MSDVTTDALHATFTRGGVAVRVVFVGGEVQEITLDLPTTYDDTTHLTDCLRDALILARDARTLVRSYLKASNQPRVPRRACSRGEITPT